MMTHLKNPATMAARLHLALNAAQARLRREHSREHEVDLTSRAGEGAPLWSIIGISLVAALALLVLTPIGQRMMTLGTAANAQVQQLPTSW